MPCRLPGRYSARPDAADTHEGLLGEHMGCRSKFSQRLGRPGGGGHVAVQSILFSGSHSDDVKPNCGEQSLHGGEIGGAFHRVPHHFPSRDCHSNDLLWKGLGRRFVSSRGTSSMSFEKSLIQGVSPRRCGASHCGPSCVCCSHVSKPLLG